jgi:hypothetical protein
LKKGNAAHGAVDVLVGPTLDVPEALEHPHRARYRKHHCQALEHLRVRALEQAQKKVQNTDLSVSTGKIY